MRPVTEAELAEAVAGAIRAPCWCGAAERGPSGMRSAKCWRPAGLSGVELYEPGALTLVVRAGTAAGRGGAGAGGRAAAAGLRAA